MKPDGTGPAVIAELAQRKLETAIRRAGVSVDVGVLTANPRSNKTEDPLAIVCDFASKIDEKVLRETHRLAWSFSRSPMLVTVEPDLVRVWTCWRQPQQDLQELCIERLEGDLFEGGSLSVQAANALQWVELASGNFFRNPRYSKYFHRDQRADQLMLEDLRGVRQRLRDMELPEDICHDLLARVIFIEFLFQRKDSQGNAALNEKVLASLCEKSVLSRVHKDLASILESHGETYQFFRELNNRFNGDLFPGKGATHEEREREWKAEMDQVKVRHLKLLAKFVRGEMDMGTGQLCLWKKYAFDVIPLEFISSVYEEFVSKKKGGKASGVHYTPVHIVDFMLDSVLPWDSTDWDMKILDPACGSGIFLVKAYQRLIHRWKKAHRPSCKPGAQDLRSLLENNLLGVDIDPHAVRVASFSLYLAMCDELEPRHVWRNVKFPRLRDKRLIESDFFAEDKLGFRTEEDGETYDLVVGNAPWGHDLATPLAEAWANHNKKDIWPVQYRSPGPLFLVKATFLSKEGGRVCMIQPAQALLTNRQAKAMTFRNKLFSRFKVEEVVNLAALRFGLFKESISPVCVVKLCKQTPDEEPLVYICPKPTRSREDEYIVVIEPQDINHIFWHEAATEPEVWSTLMWGGRRDLVLVRMLRQKQNLANLIASGQIRKRQGIVRGDQKKFQSEILEKRMLETKAVPPGSFLFIEAGKLPINKDGYVHSRDSTDFCSFEIPQLIIKQSWKAEGRFSSFIVLPDKSEKGIICSKSYVSVHGKKTDDMQLKAACLSYNSILAVYYLFLTSGRCSGFIPEAYVEEIVSVPIPEVKPGIFDELRDLRDVDERIRQVFGFRDAEWALIEDMNEFTLPDFKGGPHSPGRQSTRPANRERAEEETESVLVTYSDYFIRVLRAGFGQDKQISASIFTEGSQASLPMRLVAIHLETPEKPFVRVENIDSLDLIERLNELDTKFLKYRRRPAEGGIFYQRVARVYDSMSIDGRRVPTVFIVKPDQVRYWTRSMAMRDADEVAGDIMLWQEESRSK
ncbi:MAG: N-6 DNA methylase [Planctomycetota bacterium]